MVASQKMTPFEDTTDEESENVAAPSVSADEMHAAMAKLPGITVQNDMIPEVIDADEGRNKPRTV